MNVNDIPRRQFGIDDIQDGCHPFQRQYLIIRDRHLPIFNG